MKKGKCLFAFSQPSLHHLLSLVGRWIPHRSHVKSKIVREEMGERWLGECIVASLMKKCAEFY
jgi:hypothetical protein